jgi:hypothetical protein
VSSATSVWVRRSHGARSISPSPKYANVFVAAVSCANRCLMYPSTRLVARTMSCSSSSCSSGLIFFARPPALRELLCGDDQAVGGVRLDAHLELGRVLRVGAGREREPAVVVARLVDVGRLRVVSHLAARGGRAVVDDLREAEEHLRGVRTVRPHRERRGGEAGGVEVDRLAVRLHGVEQARPRVPEIPDVRHASYPPVGVSLSNVSLIGSAASKGCVERFRFHTACTTPPNETTASRAR